MVGRQASTQKCLGGTPLPPGSVNRSLALVCESLYSIDFYTDPQIHSRDGKGFGLGNMGTRGMLRFFETHRCNNICTYGLCLFIYRGTFWVLPPPT